MLVVRYLLIANGSLLTIIAIAYFLFAAKPAGYVVSAILWLVAAALFGCLPLTNPRRGERARW